MLRGCEAQTKLAEDAHEYEAFTIWEGEYVYLQMRSS